ncbi:probable caffeoyl-CoA O-methyltransferase At4g26220 [Aristolochia californica]|uniref:probable caffeoyl-CoA O-methyltransferase At4g26220 n=1 Tax=Aristolochia californica TaxID=171875 RepID=UPI0035DBE477
MATPKFPPQEKNHLKNDALHKYILETSVLPRELEQLRELRDVTKEHPRALMSTPPEEGQFLTLLVKLLNAKKTIEVGVFTGYSLLCTALALPADGMITAIDPDRATFELGLPFIKTAGVESKINFVQSEALPYLDHILEEGKEEGSYDFAYIDADKLNNANYHERLMKLVKVGGVIAYDNTLWFGSLVEPPNREWPEHFRSVREFFLNFNKMLASDSRIEISQVPICDGLTLCRRLV